MLKTTLETIKKDLKSKPKEEKNYLIGALIVLVATVFPWLSINAEGLFSVSITAWNSWGYLAVIASFLILVIYIAPFFKMNIPKIFKTKQQEQKILSSVMLAGPVFWLIETNFKFNYLGVGFYISAITSGYVFYTIVLKK